MIRHTRWRWPLAAFVACAASACSSNGPHWAKRFDQVDLATWVAVCGRQGKGFDNDTADVPYHFVAFQRPTPEHPETEPIGPMTSCNLSRRLHGQGLLSARVRADGVTQEVTPAFRQRFVALIEELLPAKMHAVLHEVAESKSEIKRRSNGFLIEGGMMEMGTDRMWKDSIMWSLAVSADD